MNMDTISADFSRAREVYELLQELDRHIGAQDASGRALLYRAKEGLRLLMISIDRPQELARQQ
jgi:hypothetical protein